MAANSSTTFAVVWNRVSNGSEKDSVSICLCTVALNCFFWVLIKEPLSLSLTAEFFFELRWKPHFISNQCCLREEGIPFISKSLHLIFECIYIGCLHLKRKFP